ASSIPERSPMMSRAIAIGMLVAAACGAAACGKDSAVSTTPTSTTTGASTEIFSGTLEAQASPFYSFTVHQSGTTSLTLASLLTSRFMPTSAQVGLGVGVPQGFG